MTVSGDRASLHNKPMRFRDRADAGRQLASRLSDLRGEPDLVVLGIPRGGVVVAHALATALGAPLDITLSHKLGAPFNEELAIGAVAEGGTRVVDELLVAQLRVPNDYIERMAQHWRQEVERRAALYRGDRPAVEVSGMVVAVVDDGVATGSTAIAALQAVRQRGARSLVLAAPVIAGESVDRLRRHADRLEYIAAPMDFMSVGGFYEDFAQVSDEEVRAMLAREQG